MDQRSYGINDLLLLLGQCTVELAYLRGRVTELERLLEQQTAEAPNGTAERRLVDVAS